MNTTDQNKDIEIIIDPLENSQLVRQVCGSAYDQMHQFYQKLEKEGEERGLIGPRESERLWERHLLNSAALVPFIQQETQQQNQHPLHIADVGSGAGFPGIVLAIMLPNHHFTLIEPMERRIEWLNEVIAELHLSNVTVQHLRAEDYQPKESFDIVTCRAVARLTKLVPWVLPLLHKNGKFIALKGKSAQQEIDKAEKEIRKAKGTNPHAYPAPVAEGLEPTTVVTITKRYNA